MSANFITGDTVARRNYWINEIVKLSGSFGADATRAEEELNAEYARDGSNACWITCGSVERFRKHTDMIRAKKSSTRNTLMRFLPSHFATWALRVPF